MPLSKPPPRVRSAMRAVRHCRHCLGDCAGDCLLPGGTGLCIHRPTRRLTFRERMRLLGSRRLWHGMLWGSGRRRA
jgi:hypothetical protein